MAATRPACAGEDREVIRSAETASASLFEEDGARPLTALSTAESAGLAADRLAAAFVREKRPTGRQSRPIYGGWSRNWGRSHARRWRRFAWAVTGSKVSPGLFEGLELLGRDKSLRRLAGRCACAWPSAAPGAGASRPAVGALPLHGRGRRAPGAVAAVSGARISDPGLSAASLPRWRRCSRRQRQRWWPWPTIEPPSRQPHGIDTAGRRSSGCRRTKPRSS